jgi:F0F1-type ATP synthase membrane subunit c/vacuolar-type H+-ATPase subunit K
MHGFFSFDYTLFKCIVEKSCFTEITYNLYNWLTIVFVVFITAVKSLALATALLPLGGCAVGLGLIFAALLRAEAYAPELSSALFGRAMLGFALIETFLVVVIAAMGVIFVM